MRSTFIAVGLLAIAPVGFANELAPPAPTPFEVRVDVPFVLPFAGMPGVPGDDVLMFVSSEIGGRGVVKGAPYSATAVSETRQTLQDGNRIVRSTSTRLYRDSQGRTRQEQSGGMVFINDVVGAKRMLLNTERKTARELPARVAIAPPAPVPPTPGVAPVPPTPPAPPAAMSAEEARTWGEAMRQWGREFSARMRGDAVAHVERDVNVVVRNDGAGPDVKERVEVVRIVDDPRAGTPMHHGMPMMAPQGQGTTSALGSRDFDGVRADGTRTTWTIPAGRIGNEKPIEIVSERWYAPDLMLVVQSRFADPRTGERIYRLDNLKRAEPSADLFRVPADFEMRVRPTPRSEKK